MPASFGILGPMVELGGVQVTELSTDESNRLYVSYFSDKYGYNGSLLVQYLEKRLGVSSLPGIVVAEDVVKTGQKAAAAKMTMDEVVGCDYKFTALSAPLANAIVELVGTTDPYFFTFMVSMVNAIKYVASGQYRMVDDGGKYGRELWETIENNFQLLLEHRLTIELGRTKMLTLDQMGSFVLTALVGRDDHANCDQAMVKSFHAATGLQLATVDYYFRRALKEEPRGKLRLPRLALEQIPIRYRVIVSELVARVISRPRFSLLAENDVVRHVREWKRDLVEGREMLDWRLFQAWADMISEKVEADWLTVGVTGYVR